MALELPFGVRNLTNTPADTKTYFNLLSDLLALPVGIRVQGQLVYVVENQSYYIWNGGTSLSITDWDNKGSDPFGASGTSTWTTLTVANDTDDLTPGSYKLNVSGGSFNVTLNGNIGDSWWFADTEKTISPNTVTINDTSSNFTDNDGTYQQGGLVFDSNGATIVVFKTSSTNYDVFLVNSGAGNTSLYQLLTEKGQPNGYAPLNSSGIIPLVHLPFTTPLVYQGVWDALTNTPTLVDGIGTTGHTYIVSVAGTQDLGLGSQTFFLQDIVIYNGTRWERVGASTAQWGTIVGTITNQTDLINYIATQIAALDLQEVTDAGNTTTNGIRVNDIGLYDSVNDAYTTIATSDGAIIATNNFNPNFFSVAGDGSNINLNTGTSFIQLDFTLASLANLQFQFPNESGTVALLSDIPNITNSIIQGGNSFTAPMIIGTNDNFGLFFETFGVERGSFSNTGVFRVNNLSGMSNRLILANSDGDLIIGADISSILTTVLAEHNVWVGNSSSQATPTVINQNSVLGRITSNVQNIPLIDAFVNPVDASNFESLSNWNSANSYLGVIDSAQQGQRYNGSNYWYLMNTNSTVIRVSKILSNVLILRQPNTVSLNAETNVTGINNGSNQIPDNYVSVGHTFNFELQGLVTSSTLSNLTIRLKNNTTTIASVTIPSVGAQQYFKLNFTGTFSSIGVSGTFRGLGTVQMVSGSYPIIMTSNATIDTENTITWNVSTEFNTGTNSFETVTYSITQQVL